MLHCLVALAACVLLAGCLASAAPAAVVPPPQGPEAETGPARRSQLPPLPPYHDLQSTPGPARSAALFTGLPGVVLGGTQYAQAGGNVAANAAGVALTPGGTGGSVTYALYSLPATGLVDETLAVQAKLAQFGSPDFAWLAVSDYAAGRWSWQQYHGGNLPILEHYKSLSGTVHLVLVPQAAGPGEPAPGLSLQVDLLLRTGTDPRAYAPDGPVLLEVGPGQPYATLEAAYSAAPASGGALISVHPQAGNAPYGMPALQIYKPGIQFRAVPAAGGQRIKLDGTGFNYTGAGSVPRAVFQFNPGADGGEVRGFEIYGAHNDSYNGAAVRINQANGVGVLDCEIHACDMGIMSNGDAAADPPTGADQLIEGCLIHSCGNPADPGYNHNLYLGGASAVLRGCEVYGSLTGHNVKSRAHFNLLVGCFIHDSANRELDLVDDAANTGLAGSDAYLIGCIIAKDPACAGNRSVIHFGQDGGGPHAGELVLVHCTITTPFISPVVALSSGGASARLINNILWDQASGQSGQELAVASGGAVLTNVSGAGNWLSSGFILPAGVPAGSNTQAASGVSPAFAAAAGGDYRLNAELPGYPGGAAWDLAAELPTVPGRTTQPGDRLWYCFAAAAGGPGLAARGFLGLPEAGAYEYLL